MPRLQRSRTVCHRCHKRKTACDLQLASGPDAKCSTCKAAGAECALRPSNKGRCLKATAGRPHVESTRSTIHSRSRVGPSSPAYLGEMSFHTLLNPKYNDISAPDHSKGSGAPLHAAPIDDVPPRIRQSSLETFHEFFYTWCPILDAGLSAEASRDVQCTLIVHGLALLQGNFRPPLTPHASTADHYLRARQLFYSQEPIDALDRIRACMLFYWWSTAPPNVVNIDNSFWWTGVAIRLAQQIGLHREPGPEDENAGLKRRIWWTLYARDRIIAWCQGRPCIIDEDYHDVRPPLPGDFPDRKAPEAEIFTYWVRLSVIIGHSNKELFKARRAKRSVCTISLAAELVEWIRSVPVHLSLPLATEQAVPYDRDVLLLYLPYLTTISLIYLTQTESRLPGASVAAVLAAACTARILEEFLVRGCLRFLPGEVGWYIAVAVLSLLPVRSLPYLKPHALVHIRTLLIALEHMARLWHSARMLHNGLSRVVEADPSAADTVGQGVPLEVHQAQSNSLDKLCAGDGVIWTDFFPFASEKTSPLVAAILVECRNTYSELWPYTDWPGDFDEIFNELRSLPFMEALAPIS